MIGKVVLIIYMTYQGGVSKEQHLYFDTLSQCYEALGKVKIDMSKEKESTWIITATCGYEK